MRDLPKHELIGLRVEVLAAPDPTHVGVRGTVVDETKNLLTIEQAGKEKRIPKQGGRFRFDVDGGVVVEGDRLRFRPEDRVKRAR